MKFRTVYLTVAALIAASALVIVTAVAGQNRADSAGAPSEANVRQNDGQLIARRAFSIPFGIDSTLQLVDDGNAVIVTGHGECEEGAQTFKLRMRVTQGSNRAPATGATTWRCANAGHWEVTAHTPPPFTFEEGAAEVCPMAIVEVREGGNVVRNQASWGCQEVTLVSSTALP